MMTLDEEIRVKADLIKEHYGSLPAAFVISDKEFYKLSSEVPLDIQTYYDGSLVPHFYYYGMELLIRNESI